MANIIAVVGLPGSGKSEVIKYLLKKLHCPKVYFGEVTFDEMKKRRLPINEKNERMVREDLRKKFGTDYYAKQIIKKIKEIKNEKNILVESLYSWPEYLLFKKTFKSDFLAIAVYAPSKIRYQRLKNRPKRPLNGKEAKSRDYSQIENLHQAGPIAMADYTIVNTGSINDIFKQVDTIMHKLFAGKIV